MFNELASKNKEIHRKKAVRKGSRISSKMKRSMAASKKKPGSISKKKHDVASTVPKEKAGGNDADVKTGLSDIEKKLAYYKKLRDRKKISEEVYQKKKRELLKHL